MVRGFCGFKERILLGAWDNHFAEDARLDVGRDSPRKLDQAHNHLDAVLHQSDADSGIGIFHRLLCDNDLQVAKFPHETPSLFHLQTLPGSDNLLARTWIRGLLWEPISGNLLQVWVGGISKPDSTALLDERIPSALDVGHYGPAIHQLRV